MSAIERFDKHGVLLRYATDAPIRAGGKRQPSDRQRVALLKAERELAALEIILDALDLSDIGQDRVNWALHTLAGALQLQRTELGLQAPRALKPA